MEIETKVVDSNEPNQNKNDNVENEKHFDIFSYLHRIYKMYGIYDEDFNRFIIYIKKRRNKLKKSVLFKIQKVGKNIMKYYEEELINEKYFELLILEVEINRCKYIQVKTNMSNLKYSDRTKFKYLRSIRRAVKKMEFLYNIKKRVDKYTELQLKCFRLYIEIILLVEQSNYEKCLSNIDEFIKLIKLIKRIRMNSLLENKENEKTEKINEIKNNENDKIFMKKSDKVIEEEKKIEETFDYFLSIINSYERICLYNIKKKEKSLINQKLEEKDFDETIEPLYIIEKEDIINENSNKKIDISILDNITILTLNNVRYKIQTHCNSLFKIKNLIDAVEVVIGDDIIKSLILSNDVKDIKQNIQILFKFLNNYDSKFVIDKYGNVMLKYFDCISIVHEELIKTTNQKNEFFNTFDQIWNSLENYLFSERYYLDIERTLLVLMNNLYNLYNKDEISSFSFNNKQSFSDLIDYIPILVEEIRYADILKQNIDELKNLEKDDIFISILQIIKNLKSLCIAFYYVYIKKNAEAHILFQTIKSRSYLYIKINENYKTSLLRILILFNRLQDLVYIINERYYIRHLSIYALEVKKKTLNNLYFTDNNFIHPKISLLSINPVSVDLPTIYNQYVSSYDLISNDMYKTEKDTTFRRLIKTFWKK